jgi:DNA-binding LacI/PurR family transcriptional regulator
LGAIVPTIADIAKRAGVSISTVSYALSGKRPISAATRERVNAAIEELGFRPNQAGRALASKRSNTIAMLYPSHAQVLSEMPLEFIVSAAAEAARRGYSLLLSTTPVEDEEMLRLIDQGFVDGLILMEVKLDDPRVPLLRQHGYPFALIGHCRDNDGISYVDIDFEHAVEVAVDHLTGLGHRQIALISRGAELHEAGYGPSVRSEAGFLRVARERGIEPIVGFSDHGPLGGFETARTLLTDHPRLGAIVTLNTEAIGGIMRAIQEAELRIPDDFSVVAITSPRIAMLIAPPLTTVDFPAEEMGRLGAELLIRRLEGGDAEPIQCLLRGTLTVRGSSGPYARSRWTRPRRARRGGDVRPAGIDDGRAS